MEKQKDLTEKANDEIATAEKEAELIKTQNDGKLKECDDDLENTKE